MHLNCFRSSDAAGPCEAAGDDEAARGKQSASPMLAGWQSY